MKAAAPLRATTSSLLALVLSLGTAGCAPIMKSTTLQTKSVGSRSALVNFVRPRILKGDATVIDLWDGDTFVGVIGAGSMIQYQAQPADHVFMIRRGSNWSFIKARLTAGKQYFIKVNVSADGDRSEGSGPVCFEADRGCKRSTPRLPRGAWELRRATPGIRNLAGSVTAHDEPTPVVWFVRSQCQDIEPPFAGIEAPATSRTKPTPEITSGSSRTVLESKPRQHPGSTVHPRTSTLKKPT